jgi:endo-1,3(4)-beta-glucanase
LTLISCRKCLITAAYSQKNPQLAAEWSSRMTDWGTGNTFTNTLHFISTRPSPSGQPICATLPQNPYGRFKIQVADGPFADKYVVPTQGPSELVVPMTGSGDAAIFQGEYAPNAGSIKWLGNDLYVTADRSGTMALSAIRGIAQAWERLVIRPKVGAASGVYTIKAASNGNFVNIDDNGRLINQVVNEASATGFRFPAASSGSPTS